METLFEMKVTFPELLRERLTKRLALIFCCKVSAEFRIRLYAFVKFSRLLSAWMVLSEIERIAAAEPPVLLMTFRMAEVLEVKVKPLMLFWLILIREPAPP